MNSLLQLTLKKVIKELKFGNYKDADLELQRALQENFSNVEIIFDLGIAYAKANQFSEALVVLNCLQPYLSNDVRMPYNQGLIHSFQENHQAAIQAYDLGLKIAPGYAELWLNKGNALHKLRRYDDAIAHYDQVLRLKPDYAQAYSNKGNVLQDLECFNDAITHYDQALRLKPDYADAYSNKAAALNGLGLFEGAIDCCDHALSLNPNYVEAWYNKAAALNGLGRFNEAIAHYDQSLNLKPDYAEALWNKSLILLLQGDFENGLPLYENRWRSEKASEAAGKRIFDKPLWLGEGSLADKTILLYGEQGLGDLIQFCRYVKLVADLGARIILEVPQALASLMDNLDGVYQLILKGQELPTHDYQCPILTLPLVFKTKTINSIPGINRYINLDNKLDKVAWWSKRLGVKTKLRIGLVWSGSTQHKNDHNRSLALKTLLPYLPEGFQYISLKNELCEADLSILQGNLWILNYAHYLNDFSDTAALINNLDLVITVDTSVAHLSATLGKKTWVLLPYIPDWRWLLDRDDSPWYPSIKLYRQSAAGDWAPVFEKIKENLAAMA
ncbi:tetratricopeptide repeat protein [Polynucleobacter paneuropaeus]|nr:tetratricopeptide repeat protein [Polynucleobacter paneuropaeus]